MASSKLRIASLRATFAVAMIAMVAIPATVANARVVPAIKHGGNLVVDPSPVSSWNDAFNPIVSGANEYGAKGLIYEPLVYYNGETSKPTPWLAKSWGWSNHAKTLWFKIRTGVKWNDGKPFTPADVVYSANLTMRQPAFDQAGMDPYVKSVTRSGDKVMFNLKSVNSTMAYYIGLDLYILPKHIWSKISNPVTWQDPKPVGTGPYMLKSFSPEQYVLKANRHYWQHGKPYVSTLTYPAYTTNASAENDILSGKTQWGGIFIENAAKYYVPKASGNHFWYNPANQPACLYLNDAKQPFSNVWVRRAITEVINRNQVYRQGEYGYEPPSNAGFIQPQFKKTWASSKILKMLNLKGNVKAAKADLKNAMKNSATAAALKKTFNIVVVSGWSDWDLSVGIIASELSSIGIHAVEDETDYNTYNNDLNTGNYDMGMSWTYNGPNPYAIYKYSFGSNFYRPVGTDDQGNNRSRYKNSKLDGLIKSFTLTTKQSKQVAIMKNMENIAASKVPLVPLVTQAFWDEYNTAKFTGFPTSKNQYDIGSPYQAYDMEIVALRIHLK